MNATMTQPRVGGAFNIFDESTVFVRDSTVSNAVNALGRGGAFNLRNSELTLRRVTATGCVGGLGGVVCLLRSSLHAQDCDFSSSFALSASLVASISSAGLLGGGAVVA